jgi:hypothetical protein
MVKELFIAIRHNKPEMHSEKVINFPIINSQEPFMEWMLW